MPVIIHVVSILSALLALLAVIELLRKGQLRERHAVWWIIFSLLAVVLTIFPFLLGGLATLLGVEVPLNLAFFAAIVVLFLVSLQQSKELTRLEERSRTLAEQVSLLVDRVGELESPSDQEGTSL